MKKKTNMILAGVAVALLTGCAGDEQLKEMVNKQGVVAKTADASKEAATTAVEQNAALLRATLNSTGGGWTAGDSICTYSLQSMKHNSYVLSSGAGSLVANFSRTAGSNNYEDGGTVYAVSSTEYLYGLSARMGGGALLSVTIPQDYKADKVGTAEGCLRMPVPFWGTATFGSDGCLEAEMSGMTALLRVDCANLPADARALVLTTHSYTDLIDAATTPEGGDGKPLSGTFDAVLEAGAQLAPNPIFYSYDTLRVSLDGASAYHHLYIPVVSARYQALHVIAVTGDSRYAYEWQGRVLKTFGQDTPFSPNTVVALEPETTAIHTPRM